MRRIVLAACAVFVPVAASAHEYWLEPEKTSGQPGSRVPVRLWLGETLKAEEERPFQKGRIVSLAARDAKGKRDLIGAGVEGAKPFLTTALGPPGGHLLGCERTPSTITLDAAKFTAYLKEEGLDAIVAERARLGESDAEGRERYSRHLKALIVSGGRRDETYGAVLGHRLEIIPLDDPTRVEAARLRVRVLFEGMPLGDATVFADVRGDGPIRTRSAKTDRDGMAAVPIEGRGFVLLRLVHMRRAAGGDGAADWESFWAAYTFGNEG